MTRRTEASTVGRVWRRAATPGRRRSGRQELRRLQERARPALPGPVSVEGVQTAGGTGGCTGPLRGGLRGAGRDTVGDRTKFAARQVDSADDVGLAEQLALAEASACRRDPSDENARPTLLGAPPRVRLSLETMPIDQVGSARPYTRRKPSAQVQSFLGSFLGRRRLQERRLAAEDRGSAALCFLGWDVCVCAVMF